MKTITTPIAIANNMNNITKWSVLRAIDHDEVTPPWMEIVVQAQGGGAKIYPAAGQTWTLVAVDAGTCLCLDANPTPLSFGDQLRTSSKTLTGTPYTTIAAANVGSKNAARLAVEAACLSTGLVGAALAGT